MPRLSRPLFLAMLLISFALAATASRAEESKVDPNLAQKLLTVEDFKNNLPKTPDELDLQAFLKLKEQGKVTVLDVRDKESFDRRHLKGSINAPLTGLTEKTLPALLPDKAAPVVLACAYSFMPVRMIAMTMQAYPVLSASGYTSIYRLNLWHDKTGGKMHDDAEQAKALEFEGTDVHPVEPPKK